MEDTISQERRNALEQMESTPNTQRRLVIFADYGLDDACATLYLLEHREQFDHIDILPVGGNVHAVEALSNIRKLLGAARDSGTDLRGVRIIDSTDQYQRYCHLPGIHGEDGMGDLLPSVKSSPVPQVPYADWTGEIEEGYRILSLGPCTMVRRALGDVKNLPGGRILIMGGCIHEEPNYNGREFNDGVDHFAFNWTVRRPHAAVTLDTCRVPAFNLAGARKTGGKLLDTFVNRSVELAQARHPEKCYIYDYIAALALVHPELFEDCPTYLPEILRDMHVLMLKKEYSDRRDLL